MTAQSPLLTLDNLTVSLGNARPVAGISFSVAAGETFALLGESGCGKSMTALSILRLLPDVASIESGRVSLAGQELQTLPEAEMRRQRGREVAMIFQEPGACLNPVLTIGQQIGESLALHRKLKGAVAKAAAVELLQAVGIPDPERRWSDYPFQLSGGMKQRAMIAMALAGEPKLLIADEPTTALDVTIQAQVLDLLARLQRERGMAMVLISHDLGVVARMADRVGVMYAGQLVEVASRDRFFDAPAHPYAQMLFAALPEAQRRVGRLATIPGRVPPLDALFVGCRFADRCPKVMDVCRRQAPPWKTAGEGQQMRCHLDTPAQLHRTEIIVETAQEDASPAAHLPLLQVTDLQVHFPIRRGLLQRTLGHVKAVDGVSLSLAPGRTLAVVGESGCGKTTTAKALLHLIKPSAGQVQFRGTELTGLSAKALRQARAGMQMVFQDPYASLNPRMRVKDIIAEGMDALKLPGDRIRQIGELLQQVGLAPDMTERYPHEFSGGQRQRIAIARALAVSPQLLVCDEPTSALDVSVQAQILNLLKDLQAQRRLAYLFITHNIAVVDYLAHEVAVMYLGRIVEQGTADEILRDPRHPYTAALIAAVPSLVGEKSAGGAVIAGDMPSPANPPQGCHFHPRCPKADDTCRRRYPEAKSLSETRVVHCHWA
ncbi:MAG: ABC transporter ATP-binding protein [Rhodocyclaceae bacterium]|nr:MAG: ABC transporter ATP-binding protein [Rhodocyclaceae bacterium]